MTTRRVVVLDYGSGNVRSAVRALERIGAEVTLTADRQAAEEADGLAVPGVGAFAACAEGLRAVRGQEIIGRRLAGGRPVLGICVGMQVLFEHGVEHGVDSTGMGEWPGTVERLHASPLPHMGWNTVQAPAGSLLFDGIGDERFYFVHSYAVRRWEFSPEVRASAEGGNVSPEVRVSAEGGDVSPAVRTPAWDGGTVAFRPRPPLVTWSEHGGDRFVAAVENGPLSATQFHPEKSGDAGLRLLANWVKGL